MSKSLIEGNPTFRKDIPQGDDYLDVAEFFCDTIQGEGINLGQPAAFLRVQHCTQSCVWCDTKEVWRYGNPYTFEELFAIMEEGDLVKKLKQGQHLVLTGGSPVRQQAGLTAFLQLFIEKYGFKPYVEIENESTVMPTPEFIALIDCWNNSPKLDNSYNPKLFRYQPKILQTLASLNNSWFKFVVDEEASWEEIKQDFLDTGLIKKDQIILMPLGATREELEETRQKTVDIAIREGVRYCTREHVILWNKKTGV